MLKTEFDTLVESGESYVVRISANWCIPCTVLDRELESSLSNPEISSKIFKVDIEEYPDLADELGVKSIPSCFFIGSGSFLLKKGATAQDILDWVM